MNMNIMQTGNGRQFEKKEQQRQNAKKILLQEGAKEETISEVIDNPVIDFFDNRIYSTAQLSIMKAASKINVNNSLKETLRYLKSQPIRTMEKSPVFGELWDLFSKEKQNYTNIVDMEIDYSLINIFAA